MVAALKRNTCDGLTEGQTANNTNLATGSGLTFHVSRADVADASRDKKHCSHTGASPS